MCYIHLWCAILFFPQALTSFLFGFRCFFFFLYVCGYKTLRLILTFRFINNGGKTGFQWLLLYMLKRLNYSVKIFHTFNVHAPSSFRKPRLPDLKPVVDLFFSSTCEARLKIKFIMFHQLYDTQRCMGLCFAVSPSWRQGTLWLAHLMLWGYSVQWLFLLQNMGSRAWALAVVVPGL